MDTPEDRFSAAGAIVEHYPAAIPLDEARRRATPPKFSLLWMDEVEPALGTIDFVEGVLIDGGLSVVYGESNCGKTFLTCDLALHVAMGRPWMGRDVDRGGVVYVAAEGGFGIRNRLVAARQHHDIPTGLPFAVLPSTINLLHPTTDIPAFLDLIQAAGQRLPSGLPLRLIVVDTLSRALAGGDENSSEDMGALVRHADRIRTATGANLTFIHHSGKDKASGARGHSLLRAATDTEVEVAKGDWASTATIKKQRDLGGNGDTFHFALRPFEIGTNTRGKPVTSCVVIPAEAGASPTRDPLSAADRHALDLLTDEIARQGHEAPESEYIPRAVQVVHVETWRQRFYSTRPDEPAPTRQKAFQRVRQRLLQAHRIGIHDPYVWVAGNG